MKKIRCSRCRQFYDFTGIMTYYCPACTLADSEEYDRVREYIKSHQGATIVEVSEVTGISPVKITRYLKEERLELSPNSACLLRCHGCNKAITTGIYCDDCKKSLQKSVQGFGKIEDISSKMHLSDWIKN